VVENKFTTETQRKEVGGRKAGKDQIRISNIEIWNKSFYETFDNIRRGKPRKVSPRERSEQLFWKFEFWKFEFVSNFVFRISDLKFLNFQSSVFCPPTSDFRQFSDLRPPISDFRQFPCMWLRSIAWKYSWNSSAVRNGPRVFARGDGLLKEPGFVRPHSVIPDLIRNPCSSGRDGGSASGNYQGSRHLLDQTGHHRGRRRRWHLNTETWHLLFPDNY